MQSLTAHSDALLTVIDRILSEPRESVKPPRPLFALSSIFDDDDGSYGTYANPEEDPRKAHRYAQTNAGTPAARRRNRAA